MSDQTGEVTSLLNDESARGNTRADQLWALVYPELRLRAGRMFHDEKSGNILSATALVNEAFLRLAHQDAGEWRDRSHFYAVASTIMRHVLVDHARAAGAAKRGAGVVNESLDETVFSTLEDSEEGYRKAHELLEELASTHDREALVVAMRVFGGLTVDEVALELGVSPRKVKKDWAVARAMVTKLLHR